MRQAFEMLELRITKYDPSLRDESGCFLGAVGIDAIPTIARLILRNAIWCRLHGERRFYVHFGWDYYMYLGYEGDADAIRQVSTNLYLEEFHSPYCVSNHCAEE